MTRRVLRRFAVGGFALFSLILVFCIVDYRERVAQGEELQRELLGRVIATRESMLRMHPGILAYGGGSFIWVYRMQPGQFDREKRNCIEPPIQVDNSRERDPYFRENTRECLLVNREDATMRVDYQIVLGNSNLQVFLLNH